MSDIFNFLIQFFVACLGVCLPVCLILVPAGGIGSQKRGPESLELELPDGSEVPNMAARN